MRHRYDTLTEGGPTGTATGRTRGRPSTGGSRFDQRRVPTRSDADEAGTPVTTGTTILALTGADGVVLAADTRASLAGRFVTNRSVQKVESIDDRTALAFSGSVGDAQSFLRRLRLEAKRYELHHGGPMPVETVATVAGNLLRGGPYQVLDPVLAGFDTEPAVYDVDLGGGVLRTEYAASGSGMQLAYGALEDAYDAEASVETLRTVAATTVRSAAARDTASGDGLTIATITADGIDLERFDDLEAAPPLEAATHGSKRGETQDRTGDEGVY